MPRYGWPTTILVLFLVGGSARADEKERLENALRYAEALIQKTEAKLQTLDEEIAELDAQIRKREGDAQVLQAALARHQARLQPLAEEVRRGVADAQERYDREKRAVDAEIQRDEALGKLGIQNLETLEAQARIHAHPDAFLEGWHKGRKEKVAERQRIQKVLDDAKRLRWEVKGGLAALGQPSPAGPGPGGVPFVAGWQMPTARVAVDMPVPLDTGPGWSVFAPNGSLLTFHPEHGDAASYVDLLAPSGPMNADEALERFEAAAKLWSRLMAGGWTLGFESGAVRKVDGDYLVRVVIDGAVRYEYRHPAQDRTATLGWLEFAPLAETVPYTQGGATAPATPAAAPPTTHEGYYEAKITLVTVQGLVHRAARLVDVERETLVDEVTDPKTGAVRQVPVTTAYARDLAAKVRENQIRALAQPVDLPDPSRSSPYHPAPKPAEYRAMYRDRCMHESSVECKRVFELLRKTPGCGPADMIQVLRTWSMALNHLLNSPRWTHDSYSPFTTMNQFVWGCKTVGSIESYALLKQVADRLRVKSVDEPRIQGIADGMCQHLADLSISVGEFDRAERDLSTVTNREPWWPTSAQLQDLAAKLDVR